MVQTLLEAGAAVERAAGLTSPLAIACWEGHGAVAALLLARGASLHSSDEAGLTPLLISCWQSHAELVELLLESSADPDTPMRDGSTALHVACERAHLQIAALLIARRCAIDLPGGCHLRATAILGRLPRGAWWWAYWAWWPY